MPCGKFGGSAAILLVVGLTFFSQNLALFQCASFFPRSQAGIEIGETLVGATLSAFPLAMFFAVPLPSLLQPCIGIHGLILVGLAMNILGNLAFGVAGSSIGLVRGNSTQFADSGGFDLDGGARGARSHPHLLPAMMAAPRDGATADAADDGVDTNVPLAVVLIVCRAVAGTGTGLSETGALALASLEFRDHMGKVLSANEAVIGAAISFGFYFGGVTYEAGRHTPFGAFVFPFICVSIILLATLLFVLCATLAQRGKGRLRRSSSSSSANNLQAGAATDSASSLPSTSGKRTLWTAQRIVTALVCALALVPVEGLAPIAEPYLRAPPYNLTVSEVGATQAIGSGAYLLFALPVGVLNDMITKRGVAFGHSCFRLMMLGGVLLYAASWWLFASAETFYGGSDPFFWFVLALTALGLACALVLVPTLPDMQLGLPEDDEEATTKVCAVWNAMIGLGAAFGAQFSAVLYDTLSFEWTCYGEMIVCAVTAVVIVLGQWADRRRRKHRRREAAWRRRAQASAESLTSPLNSVAAMDDGR